MSLVVDSRNQQIMYVATERGDIVIVEVLNNRGSEDVECKIKGRISVKSEEWKAGDVLKIET